MTLFNDLLVRFGVGVCGRAYPDNGLSSVEEQRKDEDGDYDAFGKTHESTAPRNMLVSGSKGDNRGRALDTGAKHGRGNPGGDRD